MKKMRLTLVALLVVIAFLGAQVAYAQVVISTNVVDGGAYPTTTFELGQQSVGVFYNASYVPADSTFRVVISRPNGSIAFDTGNVAGNNPVYSGDWFFWWWFWVPVDTTGKWQLQLYINGTNYGAPTFNVVTYPSATAKYAIRDLGTFGSAGGTCTPWRVNAGRQTAGSAGGGSNFKGTHAFLQTPTVGKWDITYAQGNSNAYGVNRSGQTVGVATLSGGARHAFFFVGPWGLRDLGTLSGYSKESLAYDINDAGQVVGYSTASAKVSHAFLYGPGGMTDLLPTDSFSLATCINNGGQVAGFTSTSNGILYPFLWTPSVPNGTQGTSTILKALGAKAWPNRLNDAGQIAGYYFLGSGTVIHAFLYGSAGLTDLGSFAGSTGDSLAFDLNRFGDVVGESQYPGTNSTHAFLYTHHTMTDLNTLILDKSWMLLAANGINDAGEIVGIGTHNGKKRGFMLTPVLYDAVSLGTLGGSTSYANAINDNSQVTGWAATNTDAAAHAFLWQNGGMADLDTLGGINSYANAISASGQIVGGSNTSGQTATHAFLWQNGGMTDLGTLGGTNSWAEGIDASGRIVGISDLGGQVANHGFLWHSGKMVDLGTLGGTNSYAFRINTSSQIIGYSDLAGQTATHAFLWQKSKLTDLGTLGGTNSYADGINDSGQIVGYSDTPDQTADHGFLWKNSEMTDLGTLGGTNSWAESINSSGQIVGAAQLTAGYETQAMVYDGTTMASTWSMVDPSSGWQMQVAYAVNNAGEMVGSGNLLGSANYTACLLRPYPVITKIAASGINVHSASIQWNTKVTSTSTVQYGVSASYGSTATGSAGTTHSIGLTNLKSGVLYHYQVLSEDMFGRSAKSADHTFRTQ